jgi:hypothetical protein
MIINMPIDTIDRKNRSFLVTSSIVQGKDSEFIFFTSARNEGLYDNYCWGLRTDHYLGDREWVVHVTPTLSGGSLIRAYFYDDMKKPLPKDYISVWAQKQSSLVQNMLDLCKTPIKQSKPLQEYSTIEEEIKNQEDMIINDLQKDEKQGKKGDKHKILSDDSEEYFKKFAGKRKKVD